MLGVAAERRMADVAVQHDDMLAVHRRQAPERPRDRRLAFLRPRRGHRDDARPVRPQRQARRAAHEAARRAPTAACARHIPRCWHALQRAARRCAGSARGTAGRAPTAHRRRCGRCCRQARARRPAAARTRCRTPSPRAIQGPVRGKLGRPGDQRQRDLVRVRRLDRRLLRGLLNALQHRLQQAARRLRIAQHRIQRDLRLCVPRDLRLLLAQVAAAAHRPVRGRRAHRRRWRRPRGRSRRRRFGPHRRAALRMARTSGWLAPSRPSIDCSSADN